MEKLNEEIYAECLKQADKLHSIGTGTDLDTFELADFLYKDQITKLEREFYIDQKLIDFNDEIMEIEELEDIEMIDIAVTGDNLFYANDILVKNSFGLPMSLDFFFALVTDEVLMENNRQKIIALKTRWGNKSKLKPQLVGVDFDKMRYTDVDDDSSSRESASEKAEATRERVKKKKGNTSIDDINWD